MIANLASAPQLLSRQDFFLVRKAIKHCCCQNLIIHELSPLCKARVAGENGCPLFIAFTNQVKQVIGLKRGKIGVPNLVNDQHLWRNVATKPRFECVLLTGLLQIFYQIREGTEKDRIACIERFSSQTEG